MWPHIVNIVLRWAHFAELHNKTTQALESEDDDDDDDVTKKHNLREISDGRSDEARDHDALANVVEATQSARSRCMNMLSALSHVGADFLRSITTLSKHHHTAFGLMLSGTLPE